MLGAAFHRMRLGWQRRRLLAPWLSLAERGDALSAEHLAEIRPMARQVRRAAERLLLRAEAQVQRAALPRLPGTDALWRPDPWATPMIPAGQVAPAPRCPLGPGATLFHDGRPESVILRQIRNSGPTDLAPFGLRFEVFDLQGRFVSLSLDLPSWLAAGLTRRQILRLDLDLAVEPPQEVYARLNILQGPNTETQVCHQPMATPHTVMEFDLAFARVEDPRIGKVWLDVILQDPAQNAVTLRDLVVSRRLRAEI